MIRKNINVAESLLFTDEYKAYNRMNKIIPHYSVNHSKEYVKGDIHTNTIEVFGLSLSVGLWVSFTGLVRNTLTLILTSSAIDIMLERLIIQ